MKEIKYKPKIKLDINFKKIIPVIIILFIIYFLSNCIYVVSEDKYNIVYRFQKVVKVDSEAGLKFKLPVDKNKQLSKKYLIHDLPPSDVITKDKKNMVVDTFIVWNIKSPLKLLQTMGSVAEAQRRIEATVYGNLKTISGRFEQDNILENRVNNEIDTFVLENTQKTINLETYGIDIIDIQVQRFDLHDDNREAVYKRMISEREQIATTYRAEGKEEAEKIKNNANRQKEIILAQAKSEREKRMAEGESEYMKIINSAYNTPEKQEFYKYLISLDALKESLKNNTIILGNENRLTNILNGK